MPTARDIIEQEQLLKMHREALSVLLTQYTIHGHTDVPYRILADIQQRQDQIQRSKHILHAWGIPTEDHPDDTFPIIFDRSSYQQIKPASRATSWYVLVQEPLRVTYYTILYVTLLLTLKFVTNGDMVYTFGLLALIIVCVKILLR